MDVKPQDTLYRRIAEKKPLTEDEIESAIRLLGYRCQARTKYALYRRLSIITLQPNQGIYNRVIIHKGGRVSYCAGQSYPDEIRCVRELIQRGR